MLKWKLLIIQILLLCSCNENTKQNKKGDAQDASQYQKVAPLKMSILGLYVQHYSGGNTHSFKIGYGNGHYTGEYTEIQEDTENVTKLEEVLVDTVAGTVILKMKGLTRKAQITPEELLLEDDDFPFSKME